MDIVEIKGMVAPGRVVSFDGFEVGALWYRAENGFRFPVPLEDTGSTPFKATDKAILFMRWIRRAIGAGLGQRAASASELDGAARFDRYQAGNFWYRLAGGQEFAIPAANITRLHTEIPIPDVPAFLDAYRASLANARQTQTA